MTRASMTRAWLRATLVLSLAACTPQLDKPTPITKTEDNGSTDKQGTLRASAAQALDKSEEAAFQKAISEAIATKEASEFDRSFDAIDQGEALEHATLTQQALDARARTTEELFVVGDELFAFRFTSREGLGNGLAKRPGVRAGNKPPPNMRRVHKSRFGGPDSFSCEACHAKGGPDGAGTATQNAYLRGNGRDSTRADIRNPPHLLGLGPVQALAAEMSAELQGKREAARALAKRSGEKVEAALVSKTVSFGKAVAFPNGEVQLIVQGIDKDLIVRPFGWKGHSRNLRAMAEESFRIHLGLLSSRIQEQYRDNEIGKEDLGDGIWFDVDRDGRDFEIDSGMLTTMAAYLSQLEIPVLRPPTDPILAQAFERGKLSFDKLGCASCHTRSLPLYETRIVIGSYKVPSAEDAPPRISEQRKPIIVDVAVDGDEPKIATLQDASGYAVELYSDLKRHHMGDKLHSGFDEGNLDKSVFLTRPLWGLADTAPYLHDGRAPSVRDAILWHGGEGASSRNAFADLSKAAQGDLLVFLLSLDRQAKLVLP